MTANDGPAWAIAGVSPTRDEATSAAAPDRVVQRARLTVVGAHLLLFIGVAAIVIVVPGPDTAVVTKNVLIHGRRTALGTSLGVSAGLWVWTLAAAVGVASLVRTSAVAFTVLKLIGALYLVWLGLQALRAAGHAATGEQASVAAARPAMLRTRRTPSFVFMAKSYSAGPRPVFPIPTSM